ncbi:MAG: hypothetical protein Harvfovirus37_6 [Harvfovirus sp.]|uniref:Uncharacterized protein n=1 Tax=Harvfovirus sp. TaxID=2487768 RepID=A0A3G5A2Q0_9VIRU|nr:MAG: hypothetical protein Harvfovirus37_6 [Harvfovirus sp.]
MKSGKIYVQIASYRDNQLVETIKDCIKNSGKPENLVFGIAWQHAREDTWDTLDEFKDDPRFRIIDIDYRDSRGVCWARNKVQQCYDMEEYTLMLDSHHRFVSGWDLELVAMMKDLRDGGREKPLLTAYLPSYDPLNDPLGRVLRPWKINFDRFTPEGVLLFFPEIIEESFSAPIPSRFISAHFCFTLGIFCKEVEYDPNYYFHGEEISITVRAFTAGYDLFTLHKLIAWHEYTRAHRKKHWDDCVIWPEMNVGSFERLRKLLGVDATVNDIDFGNYGLGSVRSLSDYEKYAGVCFSGRGVQQYTLDNKLPPNPIIGEPFINVFKDCLNIHKSQLQYSDYKFLAVIFEDREGKVIFRQDVCDEELRKLLGERDQFYKIWRTFVYGERPYRFIVWPFSEKHGWCERIEEVIYKHIV